MSNENNTPIEGGGEALPAADVAGDKAWKEKPTTKPDAAAAGGEADGDAESKAAKEAEEASERKKNRTREYIAKLNRERAELAAENAALKAAQAAPKPTTHAAPAEGKPTLEQFNFDQDAYLEALADWKVEQHLKQREESTKQAESAKSQQEIVGAYNTAAAEFADAHPDFPEVVGSIQYPLSDALQAAIMAHPKGPEIAYHLGTNDDDAFALASIQPALAAAAVERLASRLTAAPEAPQTPINPKPVSKAPAPAPIVSGRSPTEVPPEKMTDDEWYRQQQAKRASK
jgi:hypothetical protein